MANRSVKRKQPRVLSDSETLDSLTPWKAHVKAYFRDDPTWGLFAREATRWNTSAVDWGFQPDTDAAGHVTYSADQKKADCENFLNEVTCYLPGGYIRDRITKATNSFEKVFEHIFSYYGCIVSQDTMPEFMSLTKNKSESHLQFFFRLVYHQRMHLMTLAGETVEDAAVPARGDQLTVSHMNLVALVWMDKIHRQLNSRVRVEYGVRLKRGEALSGMIEEISANIPTLLKDCKEKETARTDVSGVDQVKFEKAVNAEVRRFFRAKGKDSSGNDSKPKFQNEPKSKPCINVSMYQCISVKDKRWVT